MPKEEKPKTKEIPMSWSTTEVETFAALAGKFGENEAYHRLLRAGANPETVSRALASYRSERAWRDHMAEVWNEEAREHAWDSGAFVQGTARLNKDPDESWK